ncbi:MAG TPA: OstA-like protein, partial [Bacteroidia bacterium]|nr:OstA-like protein [Bacteroidia bacterium]
MVIPVSRMRSRFFLAICLLLLFTGSVVFAQQPTRIELLNADVSEFDESLEANALRLIGNVAFRHEGATMQCDSAYLYRDDNRLEAFSRINMRQGDSLQLRGKHLYYDGNTKIAQVFEDVVLSDGRMTLHTRQLDYNLGTDIASYTDSAMILDGDNRLSSKTGYYYSDRRDLYFKQNVLLVNPRYTLTCDTLRYNTVEKTAYFLGPTRINSSSNTMYCEQGWYNTNSQQTSFQGNSYLLTRTQMLRGDSILYDRSSGIGRVFGHVSITDTVNRLIIRGDYGEHHELTDSSWVTGNAELVQIFDTDSLFMHADTLLATAADSLPVVSGDTVKQNNRNLKKRKLSNCV